MSPTATAPDQSATQNLPMADAIDRLDQRRLYLNERIKAKKVVGWETVYDQSEHDALKMVLSTKRPHTPAPPLRIRHSHTPSTMVAEPHTNRTITVMTRVSEDVLHVTYCNALTDAEPSITTVILSDQPLHVLGVDDAKLPAVGHTVAIWD